MNLLLETCKFEPWLYQSSFPPHIKYHEKSS